MALLRRYILPLLEKHGVNLVFVGHDHLYERSQKGEMYFVTAGGGGAPLYGATDDPAQNPYSKLVVSKYGYCVVEADKNSLKVTAYDVDNQIIDRIGLSGGKATIARLARKTRSSLRMLSPSASCSMPRTGVSR